jgi:prepilin-type N-terminal cleavage/methylation domain-containing protein
MTNNNRIHEYVPVLCTDSKSATQKDGVKGFSLIELIVSMSLTLIILGVAVTVFSSALSTRERESSKTDGITSTQAALNIMLREIGNSGFGLKTNGIVTADSNDKQLHIRANIVNNDSATDDAGEDITYYWDSTSQSVVRYDAVSGSRSGIINRVSDVDFVYYDYDPVTNTLNSTPSSTPDAINTSRVTIILKVNLPDVVGQPSGQIVTVKSDVTLRNSRYMLGQY